MAISMIEGAVIAAREVIKVWKLSERYNSYQIGVIVMWDVIKS